MSENIGIILEGGATRSIFTAGILDFYLDKKIEIPNVLAVSAGAYAGMNYVSKQKGRIIDSVVKPLESGKLFGASVFFKTGNFFNMDLIFDKIPRFECPFDFETFKNSGKRFITSTINCITGEAVYFDKFDTFDEFLKIERIANSLPILAKIGYINDVPMLDGGMVDAIPISKAIEEGWEKIIVILTRNKDYRKVPGKDSYDNWYTNFFYRKYKGLLKAIENRSDVYNWSLDKISELEEQGKAFVYRPPEEVTLTNREADPDTLRKYYGIGYDLAADRYEELLEFLNA